MTHISNLTLASLDLVTLTLPYMDMRAKALQCQLSTTPRAVHALSKLLSKTNVVDPDETAFFHPPLALMFTSDINEMADKMDFKTPAETATEIIF